MHSEAGLHILIIDSIIIKFYPKGYVTATEVLQVKWLKDGSLALGVGFECTFLEFKSLALART